MNRSRNLVYSTSGSHLCPTCSKPLSKCRCTPADADNKRGSGDGTVHLQRQTKGRAGKPVIVISGLSLSDIELKELARHLKAQCGVGGTVEAGTIVMQGDKRDQLKVLLETKGYRVKG